LAGRDHEVYVLQSELDDWVLEQGKEVEDQFSRTRIGARGRRPYQGWTAVWQAFAEILLRLTKSKEAELPKDESLFTEIRAAAVKAGAKDVPSLDTIRKELAKFISSKR
jgi:hypothetical protein